MPVIDTSLNARLWQQGAGDLLQQAAMLQRARQFRQEQDRLRENAAADESWRAFQRQRITQGDELERQRFELDLRRNRADADLDAETLGRLQGGMGAGRGSGMDLLLALDTGQGPIQYGPPAPGTLDSMVAAAQPAIPDSFRGAGSAARGRYIDAVQSSQALAALPNLERTLQIAVTDGYLSPVDAATYQSMAQARPQAIPQIMDDLRMLRAGAAKAKSEEEARTARLESIKPLLQSVGSKSPDLAAQVSMLAEDYARGEINAPAMLRALADLEESSGSYTPEQAAADLQAVNPRATQETALAAARLRMQGRIPVGVGEASFTGATHAPKLDLANDAEFQALRLELDDAEDELRIANYQFDEEGAKIATEKARQVRERMRNHLRSRGAGASSTSSPSQGGAPDPSPARTTAASPADDEDQYILRRIREGATDEQIADELRRIKER